MRRIIVSPFQYLKNPGTVSIKRRNEVRRVDGRGEKRGRDTRGENEPIRKHSNYFDN